MFTLNSLQHPIPGHTSKKCTQFLSSICTRIRNSGRKTELAKDEKLLFTWGRELIQYRETKGRALEFSGLLRPAVSNSKQY